MYDKNTEKSDSIEGIIHFLPDDLLVLFENENGYRAKKKFKELWPFITWIVFSLSSNFWGKTDHFSKFRGSLPKRDKTWNKDCVFYFYASKTQTHSRENTA